MRKARWRGGASFGYVAGSILGKVVYMLLAGSAVFRHGAMTPKMLYNFGAF
jgi:hypothetical protein